MDEMKPVKTFRQHPNPETDTETDVEYNCVFKDSYKTGLQMFACVWYLRDE